jgi:hypothetical protein
MPNLWSNPGLSFFKLPGWGLGGLRILSQRARRVAVHSCSLRPRDAAANAAASARHSGPTRKYGGELALPDPATWLAPQVTTSTVTSRYGATAAAASARAYPRLTTAPPGLITKARYRSSTAR